MFAIWASQSVKRYLEPLAIAANITQANDCRLDQVLLTFGFVYHFFSSLIAQLSARVWNLVGQKLIRMSLLLQLFSTPGSKWVQFDAMHSCSPKLPST